MHREYLLDTSVFLALPFSACDQLGRSSIRATASQSVPFELIAGIDINAADRELGRRQSALRKYSQLVRIASGWLPQGMVQSSFGIQPTQDATTLAKLCSTICGASDLAELRRALVSHPVYMQVRQEAARTSQAFVSAVQQTVVVFRTQTETDLINAGFSGSHTELTSYVSVLRDSGDLTRYAIIGLAQRAGCHVELPQTGLYDATLKLEARLRDVYDGSLDVYVDTYVCYLVDKILTGGSARRNDSFDLDNLFYLRPTADEQRLVSSDSALVDLVNRVHPGRAMTLSQLQDELELRIERPLSEATVRH